MSVDGSGWGPGRRTRRAMGIDGRPHPRPPVPLKPIPKPKPPPPPKEPKK